MNGSVFGSAFIRIAGIGVLLVSLLLASCRATVSPDVATLSTPSPAAIPAPTREPAYNFTLTTLDGESITLSERRGEWVLVNFWATWCPPCVREMPYLQELAETRDMHVLGVNMGESEGQVRSFVTEHGITFPILMGADQLLSIAYNARSLPQTYVVAPDGTIALRVMGAVQPETFDPWLDEQGIKK